MNKIKEFFRDWSIFEKVWLVFVCSLMTVVSFHVECKVGQPRPLIDT